MSNRISLPFDAEKVTTQLEQLSIEEQISLLSGSGFATTTAIPRLGIPSLNLAEGVNGVKDALAIDSGDTVADVLAGGGPTTVCFPSTSCYGATWNAQLMFRLGQALGTSALEKGVATIMGPGVNIHRDPRGGRNFEYFSEDPLLSGQLAAGLVNGIQQQGVGACVKHFVANDGENHRRTYDVTDPTGGRALREIYLAAFQEVLVHSNPVAIMTSYNKVQGIYTCETPLLKDVIRGEWGYEGAIQSDWFGTTSTVASIEAGQDLEVPGPSIFRGHRLLQAVNDGRVTKCQIGERASKMLEWISKVTTSKLSECLDQGQMISVAHQVASEGIVLLKNEGDVLPLQMKEPNRIAVVGLQANDPPLGGGGSSLAPPQYVSTPLDALRAVSSHPELVQFAGGVRFNKILPVVTEELTLAKNGQNGFDVVYYNDCSPDTPVFEETIPTGRVIMLGNTKPGLDPKGFHFEMSTTLRPDSTGEHRIGVQSTGAYELFIDGTEVLSAPSPNCNAEDFLFDPSKLESSLTISMSEKKEYRVKLVVQSFQSTKLKPTEPSPHTALFCLQTAQSEQDVIDEIVSVVKSSDVSIVFAGRNSEYEGEGFDMPDLDLPGNQAAMINAVAANSRRTIVVISSGGPVDVTSFCDSVDAILHAHYLGQEVGSAIADILFGKINPSGRLATTWPKRLQDAATFNHFPAIQHSEKDIELPLSEGLEVGYRRNWGQIGPRYPFGFGLSYTKFQYSDLVITPDIVGQINEHTILTVKLKLSNAGPVAGQEVVQVYANPGDVRGPHSSGALKGFSKVLLQPGASRHVEIQLNVRRAFSFWDVERGAWKVEAGKYCISIGADEVLRSHVIIEDGLQWLGL